MFGHLGYVFIGLIFLFLYLYESGFLSDLDLANPSKLAVQQAKGNFLSSFPVLGL